MTKISLTLIDKAVQKNIPIGEISTGERYRKSFSGIEELAKSIEKAKPKKVMLAEAVDNLTKEQKQMLLDLMMKGKGND